MEQSPPSADVSNDISMSSIWQQCYEQAGPDIFGKVNAFAALADQERKVGGNLFRQPFLSPNLPQSLVRDRATGGVKKVILLGSNSYLGLTAQPRVVEASIAAAKKYSVAPISN